MDRKKMSNVKCQMSNGFTLIELLVTLSLFVVIGIFATQTIATILSNRQKTEVARQVRQEADYSISVIERHLRGASSIATCNLQQVSYNDFEGRLTNFSCQGVGGEDSYIASGGARLTSTEVSVTSCQFTCTPSLSPNTVNVSFTVFQRRETTDPRERASTSVSTQVILRNR